MLDFGAARAVRERRLIPSAITKSSCFARRRFPKTQQQNYLMLTSHLAYVIAQV